MKEITADRSMVAYCGLYCGACKAHLKGKCPGCHDNAKASWCTVRSCCIDNNYTSCAECKSFSDPKDCAKFNNFFSKLFGFFFSSDRAACVAQIKAMGVEGHARQMASTGRHTIKR